MRQAAMANRIGRLEQVAAGDQVPLYIRAWLGEDLTPEQHAIADTEWTRVQALPAVDLAILAPETRAWLISREIAA
ncbi:hypothetical protein NPJ82_02650 [Sphingomonas sp. NY01]|uniref:hypothetical protein n=1 Tax=Sphingomonas sp. NY01 TaxID=2968057 RepID=UPI00315CB6E2